jgi:hypothetical protein
MGSCHAQNPRWGSPSYHRGFLYPNVASETRKYSFSFPSEVQETKNDPSACCGVNTSLFYLKKNRKRKTRRPYWTRVVCYLE